jgi:Ribonuclease HI
MSNIALYVGISGKKEFRRFIALMNDNGTEKEIIKEIDETPSNRIIIKCLSEVLNDIEAKSHITVFAPANFGFEYTNKIIKNKSVKKWDNKDVGTILANSIIKNQHKIEFINYNQSGKLEEAKLFEDRFRDNKQPIKKISIVNQEDNIFNKSDVKTTDVSLFVRGIADTSSSEKVGKYIAILNFKGKEKEIFNILPHATPNRMIIQGAIDAIGLLKVPCNIKLYTHTTFGLSNYNIKQKGVNKDLLEILFNVLQKGQHSLQEIVSNYNQDLLAEKISKIQ